MTIEKRFDITFISSLALREKQIQQNYRPIIAVHKWFARRPGTLFRGLLLSEFSDKSLREAFYTSNDFKGVAIADPFMGGGTPLIEANRIGCDVTGYDINPMAYWIVNREIEHLDLTAYRKSAEKLVCDLEEQIGLFYRTRCLTCGSTEAHVKYFLWVKQQSCLNCGYEIDLFSGYLLAEDRRHTGNVFICASCGDLNDVKDRKQPGVCKTCGKELFLSGPAKRNKCICPKCRAINTYPNAETGVPHHRMFAIEYYCRHCKTNHKGRFFKRPDKNDLENYDKAVAHLAKIEAHHIPDDRILPGDETDRLIRWGYLKYRDMFNGRQLLGLELSCKVISKETNARVKNALITNLSDLLRYQNMLCRYDTMALKSLDIFSVHGFPVGLIQCESNFLGIANGGGMSVGSGGWSNILEKYIKAKTYCETPFETRHQGSRKIQVPIMGEWIGEKKTGDAKLRPRCVRLFCQSATKAKLQPRSLDGVFTDPPYFGNVQYAELMDFCYVWVRKMVESKHPSFQFISTRNADELTGNITMERGLDHFAEGISASFQNMAKALKPGKPLVFTYHHNKLEAYHPVMVAILDSGLTCTASIPCPAEMGASIHINGTSSSIVDTVFVCRSSGVIPRKWLSETPEQLADLIRDNLENLKRGGLVPTTGDIRCIMYGHLARLAIWRLRSAWNKALPISEKLTIVRAELGRGFKLEIIENHLIVGTTQAPLRQCAYIREEESLYGELDDEISF